MFTLNMTDNALKKIGVFKTQSDGVTDTTGLRVYVQGGGCSGFEYAFKLDEPREEDNVLEFGNIRVIVDPFSAPYIQGSNVDYIEDFRGSSFQVRNPNATSTCGCGLSFTV